MQGEREVAAGVGLSLCLYATTHSGEHSRTPAAVPPLQAAPGRARNITNVPSFSFLFSLSHAILSDGHLTALTVALKSSPFDFQKTQILSSSEKEAFNWVAVNYVLENFFKVKDDPACGV